MKNFKPGTRVRVRRGKSISRLATHGYVSAIVR
jgi:hypothetical protein